VGHPGGDHLCRAEHDFLVIIDFEQTQVGRGIDDMHGSGIPIWFFIGVLLLLYGAMIFGYGIFEWISGSYPPLVQLTSLHTPVWWGGVLGLLGLFYVVKFRPGQAGK
jgi:hypothetical protein